MKLKKLFLSTLVTLCMSLCLSVAVCAVDLDDQRFREKTWEEIMDDFLAAHNTDASQVTAGYYNTVTGEEHFLNPDQLMYGASVAKLPTNMLYAERVSTGEMTMDTLIRGNRYGLLQRLSLVNSDNPAMETMVKDLGGGSYANFRRQILPYIGLTEDEVDDAFLARNFFSAKQIMYTLNLLYGNQETYPGVEECMLQASPYDYFKQNRPPYDIAHKYGWYTDNGTTYLNDSAIVYTDDPILLVMFTANVADARLVLADYCSLMCDYAQYCRTLRYANEVYEHTDLSIDTHIQFLSVDAPHTVPSGYPTWQFALVSAGCGVLVVALIVLIWKKLAALILTVLALLLIVIGGLPTELAYMAVQDGTANQVIANFQSTFGSNTRGGECLNDLDVALAHSDGDDFQTTIINLVTDSFRLEPGKAIRSGNYIAVPVTATKVDLEALNTDLQSAWESALANMLETADPEGFYDADGVFVPTMMEQAQQDAIDLLLSQWDTYLITQQATIHLMLTLDGITPTWKIMTDQPFLDLVNYA